MVHWFKALSRGVKVLLVIVALIVAGGVAVGASNAGNQQVSNPTRSDQTQKKAEPTVEHKEVTTTEPIQYTSSTVEDASLDQGTTTTRVAGVNGVRTHTYEVTYTNGIETARSEIKNEVTTQPINEVIAKGTKAPQPTCSNGTYVNADGNTVCRPEASSTVPSGASAQCSDGTYSYSQSRRGTCSHHGGVSTWL